MLRNIQLRTAYNTEPFFFRLSNNCSLPKDKFMSTNDWNLIIEMFGVDNSEKINNTITRLAIAEEKVIYAVHKKLNVIFPAIITTMEDAPDIYTVSLIVGKNNIYVMRHSDINDFVFFESRTEANQYLIPIMN